MNIICRSRKSLCSCKWKSFNIRAVNQYHPHGVKIYFYLYWGWKSSSDEDDSRPTHINHRLLSIYTKNIEKIWERYLAPTFLSRKFSPLHKKLQRRLTDGNRLNHVSTFLIYDKFRESSSEWGCMKRKIVWGKVEHWCYF
jgi:hypothetical protein